MRRQLHDLGQKRDQERLSGASSEVEKLRVEKERALQEVARLKVCVCVIQEVQMHTYVAM